MESAPPVACPGGFWRRLLALTVDSFILFLAGLAIGLSLHDVLEPWASVTPLLGLALSALYFSLLNGPVGKGRTLGKRLLGLQVLGVDGHTLSARRALWRFAVLALLIYNGVLFGLAASALPSGLLTTFGVVDGTVCLALLLGFTVLVVSDPLKRGAHDLAGGSVVIRAVSREPAPGPVSAPASPRPVVIWLAATLAILALGGAAYARYGGRLWWIQPMLQAKAAIEAETELKDVSIQSASLGGRRWSPEKGLTVSGWIPKERFDDKLARADSIRKVCAVIHRHPELTLDVDYVDVVLKSGFSLGVVSFWRSKWFSVPADRLSDAKTADEMLGILSGDPTRAKHPSGFHIPDAALARYYWDPAWVQERKYLYVDRNYDAVELFLSSVTARTDDAGREDAYHIVDFLAQPFDAARPEDRNNVPVKPEDMKAALDGWVAAKPASPFARLTRGSFFGQLAWVARRGGSESGVAPEARRLYQERLRAAKGDLDEALRLDPADPLPANFLMWVAGGLGLPNEALNDYFPKIVKLDPGNYEAFLAKLVLLEDKWYGSDSQAEAVAAEAWTLSKDHPRLRRLWPRFYFDQSNAVLKEPAVWERINDAYSGLLGLYPDDWRLHGEFAYLADRAGQYSVAISHFEAAGDHANLIADDITSYFLARGDAYYKQADADDGAGRMTEAAALYKKASDFGYAPATTSLGWLYLEGRGVPRDFAAAKALFEEGAALNEEGAMNDLGWIYENGDGVPADGPTAAQWYGKAASIGSSMAAYNLGWDLYHEGKLVPRDYAKAAQWLRVAAYDGNATAMNALGWMYQNGQAGPPDYDKAAKWYRFAIAHGDVRAKTNLADLKKRGLVY